MTDLILQEQDGIWSRKGKPLDILLCLGSKVPPYKNPRQDPYWIVDHRLSVDHSNNRIVGKLLASLFYLELVGVP